MLHQVGFDSVGLEQSSLWDASSQNLHSPSPRTHSGPHVRNLQGQLVHFSSASPSQNYFPIALSPHRAGANAMAIGSRSQSISVRSPPESLLADMQDIGTNHYLHTDEADQK